MGNNVSMSKGWNQGSNAVHLENGFGAFEVFKKPGKLFGSNYFVVWMPHRLYVKLGSEAQADTFVRTVVRPILCDGSISTFLSPQNIDQILELTEYTNAQQLTNLHVAILASPRSKPNAAKTYPFSPAIERILEQNPRTIAIKDKQGNSPLHAAAGNPAIVETLLRYVSGTVINDPNSKGKTPLHVSATSSPRAARLLLGAGAQASLVVQDKEGKTPICVAASLGNFQVLEVLLQAVYQPGVLNLMDKSGNSAFHHACRQSNAAALSCVRALIQAGADVNSKNKTGSTPMMCVADSPDPNVELFRTLASFPGIDFLATDKKSQTVLHIASMKGHEQITGEIITRSHPAIINMRNNAGETALHLSVRHITANNQARITHALLSTRPGDIHVNAQSLEKKQTPLHVAVKGGFTEAASLLLMSRADLELRDFKDRSPLLLAAKSGRKDSVEWLISRRANAGAQTGQQFGRKNAMALTRSQDIKTLLSKFALFARDEALVLQEDRRRSEALHQSELERQELLVKHAISTVPIGIPGNNSQFSGAPQASVTSFVRPTQGSEDASSGLNQPPPSYEALFDAGSKQKQNHAEQVEEKIEKRNEDADLNEETECIICFERKRDAALIPCGHAQFCMECAQNLHNASKACPCCNATITSILKIYH